MMLVATPEEQRAMRTLRAGACQPHDCGSPHAPPAWLDMDRFRRGRQFFSDHIVQCVFGMHMSLATGLCFPQLVVPMVYTGESSVPWTSVRRYLATFHHVACWHYEVGTCIHIHIHIHIHMHIHIHTHIRIHIHMHITSNCRMCGRKALRRTNPYAR
jgi:hypothetical protein